MRCLEIGFESMSLEEGKGVVHFVEPRLEGLIHAKTRPHKLDHQIGVNCHNLILFFLEVEM